MRHLGRSIRDAARAVRFAPGIPAACAAAIALGAGTGSVVFALAYGVLVRPLPFAGADRLVQITATSGARTLNFSLPEFDDWQARTAVFDALAAYTTAQAGVSSASDTRPVTGATVSGRFFETLQGPMLAGRPLGPADDRSPVVVLSERLWRRQFNGDSTLVGRALVVNDESMTIVGIARRDFAFPSADVDVWLPLGHARPAAPPQWGMRGFRGFSLIGRLRADATTAAAAGDASRVARGLAVEFPRFNRDTGVVLVPLHDALTRSARPALMLLLAAAALVVLAVCANVANLLIARGLAQQRDVAVRLALGAAPRDIAMEALAEVAWMALGGMAGAVALAATAIALVRTMSPNLVPRLADVRVDLPVIAFAGVLVVLAAAMAAAVPVGSACSTPPSAVMRGTRTGQSRKARRTYVALVVLQIVTSVTLLVGTALVGRSLAALLHVGPGVRTEGLAAAALTMAAPSFAAPPAQQALLERVLVRVAALPGVEHAGLISSLPPDGSQMRTAIAPRAQAADARDVPSEIVAVSADTFATLGVPLLRGRTFTSADTAASPRAVILSETAATLLFPRQDAVGQTLPLGAASGGTGVPLVVGVVGDVRYSGLASAAGAAVYLPFAQRPFRGTFLVLRTTTGAVVPPATLAHAIYEVDPGVAVGTLRPWTDVISDATAEPRLRVAALALLSLLAVVIAAVGLYGVMTAAVSSRSREFAVRMALGARPRRIVEMVVGQTLAMVLAGTLAGGALALAGRRVLSSLLFGVTGSDPASYFAAAACMAVVGLLASAVPAWRAAKVEPAAALKTE